MPNYSCTGTIATSSVLGVVGITAGNGPRRARIYDIIVGSDATPADNAVRYVADRAAASGTFTAQTLNPLDSADAAAVTGGGSNWSTNPALSTNLMDFVLNQRATFRWVAAPGGELVMPAVLGATIFIRNPAGNGTAAVSGVRGQLYVNE